MEEEQPAVEVSSQVVRHKNSAVEQLRESLSVDYLWKNFYIIDSTTSVTKKQFDVAAMLHKFEIKKGKREKTNFDLSYAWCSEEFSDSKKTILTIPLSALVQNLQKNWKKGYSVYHDTTRYDSINGALTGVLHTINHWKGSKYTKKNPGIKVLD